MMIKKLSSKDTSRIHDIINEAAHAYQSVIPDDCYHEPYMSIEELRHEMENITFFGWDEGGEIVAVIGYQPVKNVTLVRHLYVLPDYQRQSVGTNLLHHIKGITKTERLLVGTWADATWAIKFYQKHGFKLMPNRDELLMEFWDVPQRQIETSVVLGVET